MADQPVSLLIGEGILVAVGLVLGIVIAASWIMGRSHQTRGRSEGPPDRGDVPSESHHPASLSR